MKDTSRPRKFSLLINLYLPTLILLFSAPAVRAAITEADIAKVRKLVQVGKYAVAKAEVTILLDQNPKDPNASELQKVLDPDKTERDEIIRRVAGWIAGPAALLSVIGAICIRNREKSLEELKRKKDEEAAKHPKNRKALKHEHAEATPDQEMGMESSARETGKHTPLSRAAGIIIGIWVICPPLWFFLEWAYFSHGQQLEEFKFSQELARNFWVALVVLLAAILKGNWPLQSSGE
jgi:hypothetical protein